MSSTMSKISSRDSLATDVLEFALDAPFDRPAVPTVQTVNVLKLPLGVIHAMLDQVLFPRSELLCFELGLPFDFPFSVPDLLCFAIDRSRASLA